MATGAQVLTPPTGDSHEDGKDTLGQELKSAEQRDKNAGTARQRSEAPEGSQERRESASDAALREGSPRTRGDSARASSCHGSRAVSARAGRVSASRARGTQTRLKTGSLHVEARGYGEATKRERGDKRDPERSMESGVRLGLRG